MGGKILVTGSAGFIGYHLATRLCADGNSEVIGIDNINSYYDVNLKRARLGQLESNPNFRFQKLDISDANAMQNLFTTHQFDVVYNLAAQAGVRYSLNNPMAYVESNVAGFCNILEGCRHSQVGNLIFASTSSVYGANKLQPLSETHGVNHPLAIYAATKRANELMAHSYANLFGLPCTGLRFFTVYGPWGRPDMALFKFTESILSGNDIEVYNHGNMIRDFTYVDDIVESLVRLAKKPASPDHDWDDQAPNPATSYAPFRIFNIGNSQPVPLLDYIKALETELGTKSSMKMMPMQPGDVESTHADTSALEKYINFRPQTPITVGIRNFVAWYLRYYKQPQKDKNTAEIRVI